MVYLILDNGAGSIKAGLSLYNKPNYNIQNCIAKTKGNAMFHIYIGNELDKIKQHVDLTYLRPFERGYLINWNIEIDIWNYLFSTKCMNINPMDYSLILTCPLFNPTIIKESYDEIIFEEYNFSSCMRISSAEANYINSIKECNKNNNSFHVSNCRLIVDSGFSFTHIIPFFNNEIIMSAVKRINVGGKLLTNYLKEMVSFRNVYMMDEYQQINYIKENVCYVSTNFMEELQNKEKIAKEWVLPDFQEIKKGYARDPVETKLGMDEYGVIKSFPLSSERISVPEILFHPSDIGLNQCGIAEAITESINSCDKNLRGLLYENIILVGGNTKFQNFKDRLFQELRPNVSEEYKIRIDQLDDPIDSAWKGAAALSSNNEINKRFVSKKQYEEYGSNICTKIFSC